MQSVIAWWLVLQVIGLAALPWTVRFFGRLPDRGYAFARPVGLLGVAYLLWIGNVFGMLGNATATIVVLIVVLGLVGWLGFRAQLAALRELFTSRRRLIVVYEVLFFGAFALWAVVRSFVPEVHGTEKPMELAFLNSILRSPTLPPADPWFAGFAISYYYLGYVVVANVARLTMVSAGEAFNLALAMLFALTVTGALSLGYNLTIRARLSWFGGTLSALFVAVLGNWVGLLEFLRWHGYLSAEFLAWVGIKDLTALPEGRGAASLFPTDSIENWWWWRATRVISTYVGDTAVDYTINEFPFFSFILGDLHPHVIALPFAFVVLGYALNLLFGERELCVADLWRRPAELLFIGFLYGSLFTVNAWDMLTYLFVLALAFAAHRLISRPVLDRLFVREVGLFGALTLGTSMLLYWPFYVMFRSQAGGIGIVGIRSQPQHFAMFWGPLLFLVGAFVIVHLLRGFEVGGRRVEVARDDWTRQKVFWVGVLILGVALAVVGAPVLGFVVPLLLATVALLWRQVVGVGSILWPRVSGAGEEGPPVPDSRHLAPDTQRIAEVRGGSVPLALAREPAFAAILVATALLLLSGTELVYIRDSFGNRMNTVFKLYYQAWTLLAVASAFGVCALLRGASDRGSGGNSRVTEAMTVRASRIAILLVGGLVVGAGLVYAPMALLSRTDGFSGTPTLNGLAWFERQYAADAAAIRWLSENGATAGQPQPIVVEATGGSYSQYGRVSMLTGYPTLLGWDYHEVQWRGAGVVDEINRRRADVDAIYRNSDNQVVRQILDRYDVTYLYVGALEQDSYSRGDSSLLDRYRTFMDLVYDRNGVKIYKVRN